MANYKEPRLNSYVFVRTYKNTLEKQIVKAKQKETFTTYNGNMEVNYHYDDYMFCWFSTLQEAKQKYNIIKQGDVMYINEKRYF